MDELEKLFLAYRESSVDPEPSAAFTPGIWRRIEARRSPLPLVRRVTEAFMAVAALVAVLVGVVLVPRMQDASAYKAHYVDVLATQASEIAPYTDLIHTDLEMQQR